MDRYWRSLNSWAIFLLILLYYHSDRRYSICWYCPFRCSHSHTLWLPLLSLEHYYRQTLLIFGSFSVRSGILSLNTHTTHTHTYLHSSPHPTPHTHPHTVTWTGCLQRKQPQWAAPKHCTLRRHLVGCPHIVVLEENHATTKTKADALLINFVGGRRGQAAVYQFLVGSFYPDKPTCLEDLSSLPHYGHLHTALHTTLHTRHHTHHLHTLHCHPLLHLHTCTYLLPTAAGLASTMLDTHTLVAHHDAHPRRTLQ